MWDLAPTLASPKNGREEEIQEWELTTLTKGRMKCSSKGKRRVRENWGKRMAFTTIESLHSKSRVYIIYWKPATSQLFSKQVRNLRLWARRQFVQSRINVKGGQLWFNLFPGAGVPLLGTAYSLVLCPVPFKTCPEEPELFRNMPVRHSDLSQQDPASRLAPFHMRGEKKCGQKSEPPTRNGCTQAKMDEV